MKKQIDHPLKFLEIYFTFYDSNRRRKLLPLHFFIKIFRVVWCSFALNNGLSADLETKDQMKDEVNVSSHILVHLKNSFQRIYRTLTSGRTKVDNEDFENGRVDSNRLKLFLEK